MGLGFLSESSIMQGQSSAEESGVLNCCLALPLLNWAAFRKGADFSGPQFPELGKQRGHLFLFLEQMCEFSKSQKLKKIEVAKSWGVTLVNMMGIAAAFGDQAGLPQYYQAC